MCLFTSAPSDNPDSLSVTNFRVQVIHKMPGHTRICATRIFGRGRNWCRSRPETREGTKKPSSRYRRCLCCCRGIARASGLHFCHAKKFFVARFGNFCTADCIMCRMYVFVVSCDRLCMMLSMLKMPPFEERRAFKRS